MASNKVFILDAGHGGMIDGVYTTCPDFYKEDQSTWHKAAYHPDKDLIFYEGVWNRKVLDKLVQLLVAEDFSFKIVSDAYEDTSLSKRVEVANDINKLHDNRGVYVSIHSNYFSTKSANGIETFHYPGSQSGKKLAGIFQENLIKQTGLTDRGVKEANYYVLRETQMPAVLTESGFFSNPKDVEFMVSSEGINKIAKAHFDAILEIEG